MQNIYLHYYLIYILERKNWWLSDRRNNCNSKTLSQLTSCSGEIDIYNLSKIKISPDPLSRSDGVWLGLTSSHWFKMEFHGLSYTGEAHWPPSWLLFQGARPKHMAFFNNICWLKTHIISPKLRGQVWMIVGEAQPLKVNREVAGPWDRRQPCCSHERSNPRAAPPRPENLGEEQGLREPDRSGAGAQVTPFVKAVLTCNIGDVGQ